MIELLVIGGAIATAARWLQCDARRRDLDPKSQERSDWLEFLEAERSGEYERIRKSRRR
jgi:hypothetical protein